jgi:hypothetical protein
VSTSPVDWLERHSAYDNPDFPLSRRLLVVQRRIREALDRAPAEPVRVVARSSFAERGRDVELLAADAA